MDREYLKKYLLSKGLELIDEHEGEWAFDNDHMSIFCYPDRISLSFGHCDAGYYNLPNATMDQVKSAVDLFASAEFLPDVENGSGPMKWFKLTMLKSLTKFIDQEQS